MGLFKKCDHELIASSIEDSFKCVHCGIAFKKFKVLPQKPKNDVDRYEEELKNLKSFYDYLITNCHVEMTETVLRERQKDLADLKIKYGKI